MAERKVLNIGTSVINFSMRDKDDLRALTLAILLKAMFKNSVVTNYSIRKIIRITGFNYSLAKLSIERGLERKFFTLKDCPNGSKALVVRNLWDRKHCKAIRFQVVKFDDGHINLFFMDGKEKNEKRFTNEKKIKQTPKDYIYKVMQASICYLLQGRSEYLESATNELFIKHGMKNKKLHVDDAKSLRRYKAEINKMYEAEEEDKKIYTGISYAKIVDCLATPNNDINRYVIQKIVKMCEKEGLFGIIHNYVMVDDEMDEYDSSTPKNQKAMKNVYVPNLKKDGVVAMFEYGERTYRAIRNRIKAAYYITDDCGNITRDLHKTGYRGKGKHKNCLFMQLGNDYFATSHLFKKQNFDKEKVLERKRRCNSFYRHCRKTIKRVNKLHIVVWGC